MTSDVPSFCLNCQSELIIDKSLHGRDTVGAGLTHLSDQIGNLKLEGQGVGSLYDIICNSDSPLKGPICEACTGELLKGMDQQLKGLEDEYSNYRKLLESLKTRGINEFDESSTKRKMEKLKTEQECCLKELKELEDKEKTLDEKLNAKESKLNTVLESEEKLWREIRDNLRTLVDLEASEQDVGMQLRYVREQLDKLSKLNVLNITFHIWEQGSFGTINGFRLGRLPSMQVEWNEINTAWGQAALLLTVLFKNVEYCELEDYKIFPMGNHSFIRVLSTGEDLPLYGSGGFKPFGQKNFDEAISAYVECFRQLEKYIQVYLISEQLLWIPNRLNCPYKANSTFRLPHKMRKDYIEDNRVEYSVKMQFNSEERWTKAMKCLLINLRWTISFVVTLRSKGRLRVQNCGSLATKGCRVVSRLHGFIDLGQSSAKHLEGFTKQLGEAKLQIEEYFYLPGVLDVSHFRRSKKGVQNCGCLATKSSRDLEWKTKYEKVALDSGERLRTALQICSNYRLK
ncbi:unnamed protein product [Enterobius vermicularis]|uniref:Autophagy-related protein 6 n=1 Tax=Enterobius vermicularis TaxID=51028 RepID=A0A0N4UZG3_ENTVE|nr:unnamed protein product [Enterobius vermicularis]